MRVDRSPGYHCILQGHANVSAAYFNSKRTLVYIETRMFFYAKYFLLGVRSNFPVVGYIYLVSYLAKFSGKCHQQRYLIALFDYSALL